jgi:sphinganine C4-monooxygenase
MLYIYPFISYWLSSFLLNYFYPTVDFTKNIISKNNIILNSFFDTFSTLIINYFLYKYKVFDINILRFYYIFIGIFIVDTIEYFMHYGLHKIPFLYKNFHKEHHKIKNPYVFGALYNSLGESIIESILLFLGFYLLNFSYQEYIITITLANIATVLDHSNINIKNNFHNLHHSKYQNYNFQQPFFTYYDKIFGTYKVDL